MIHEYVNTWRWGAGHCDGLPRGNCIESRMSNFSNKVEALFLEE